MEKQQFSPFEIEASWKKALGDELYQPYITKLSNFVKTERLGKVPVYPPEELVFNAFFKTPFNSVKVLIMGQDPYHGKGQAHGLSFSVPEGIPQPPSLKNIFKELHNDLKVEPAKHGCLNSWASQGVMLLNATLTVRDSEALSHHKQGWEKFTDAVVKALCERKDPVIFVLWGKSAQEKCSFILDKTKEGGHTVLTAAHPSPFSAHSGFFGCAHFSKINEILKHQGKNPIDWRI